MGRAWILRAAGAQSEGISRERISRETSVVPGAFFGVDGQGQHQDIEGVRRIRDIQDVGVRPMEKLFGNPRNVTLTFPDGVIPLQKTALHAPALAVNGIAGAEKGKLLGNAANAARRVVKLEFRQKRKDLLLHRSHMIAVRIQNVQTVPPGELALHGLDGAAVFIINIIAVKPEEETLPKE